jgi:uncharacterized repeat protein (TIGR03803 family)
MECGARTARLGRTAAYIAFALAFSIFANAQDGFELLHSFTFGVDGALPSAPLVVNDAGSVIYGTAEGGGISNHGNVFRLVRTSQGWKGTVLHSFGQGTDGWYPDAAVISDKKGNLYGTTSEGGLYGWGTVFEMSPTGGGKWAETALHSFDFYGEDTPIAPVTFDAAGNLYGTTSQGGLGWGAIFQMTPPPSPGGQWTENVIYNFTYTNDGAFPKVDC